MGKENLFGGKARNHVQNITVAKVQNSGNGVARGTIEVERKAFAEVGKKDPVNIDIDSVLVRNLKKNSKTKKAESETTPSSDKFGREDSSSDDYNDGDELQS